MSTAGQRTTVGALFAHALAAKDSERMRSLLADPIDFAALTPGRAWQASSPEIAVDDIILGVWFSQQDHIYELRAVRTGQVADRERVSYRIGVRSGGQDYVVEQQAYYDSDGDRITWMRLLCSGYRPEGVAHGGRSAPDEVRRRRFSADEVRRRMRFSAG